MLRKRKIKLEREYTQRVEYVFATLTAVTLRKKKREFLHYQGVIRSIESAGEKNSWSQGHWVRPL